MILIKQSEGVAERRRVWFFCSDDDSADSYAPKTGLTFSSGELKISKAGNTEANHTGVVTEVGGGWYIYEPTATEANTLGVLSIRVVKTDVYSELAQAQIVAFDPYAVAGLGLTNLDVTVSSRLPTATYETVDNFLDKANAIESGVTPRGAFRLMLAVLAGKLSGAGTTTEVFRNAVADSKSRVTATVDTSGNRTAITTDQT